MTSALFRDEFLAAAGQAIAERLRADGFWFFEGALRRHAIEAIERDLSRPLKLNDNDVGPIRYGTQTYFTHGLAASKTYFDVVTHAAIRGIARAALGASFRLKCQRYVVNETGFTLTWHSDNKTSVGARTDVRGLGVVIYLQDTYEGELQVVRGSHRVVARGTKTEWSDDEVAREHAQDVVTLACRAGTVIVFDSMLMHRTRPITLPDHRRGSIFLQIDDDMAHSETIIIKTEFADPNDAEQLRYLGVGLTADYPIMPPSSMSTLRDRDLALIAARAGAALVSRRLPGPAKKALAPLVERLRR